jgi:acetyltransferase-like isoleucine patch superfamily enzyme
LGFRRPGLDLATRRLTILNMTEIASRHWRLLLSAARSRISARLGGYAIGPGVVINRLARIKPQGGAIRMGAHCTVHEFACLYGNEGSILLGDRVTVHPFTILYGDGNITVGNDVQISAHVVIVSDNLRFKDPETVISRQGRDRDGVIIDDDVWIGTHASILDGVHVAKGCVIGAGAVVTRSTDPFGVYAGVPAKQIEERKTSRPRAA